MWPRVALSNGLRVVFEVGGDASTSELAVCSTDASGSHGELSESVFQSTGIDYGRLQREFQPPFFLFENDASGGTNVLAVTTISSSRKERRWSTLTRNLRAGLEETLRGRACRTIWCGPLATGAAGMSVSDSLAAMLRAFSRVDGSGPPPIVTVSYTEETDLREALSGLSFDASVRTHDTGAGWTLRVAAGEVEPHAFAAIRHAASSAGGTAVGAGGVVRAILAQTKQGGAFEQLREYVVPRRLLAAEDRSTASPDPEAILEMAVTPVLGESLLAIPDYVRTSGWRMWGRDLITVALLADDPTLTALTAEGGTNPTSLRRQWLSFLLRDSRHLSEKDYRDWFEDSGFPPLDQAVRSGWHCQLGVDSALLRLEVVRPRSFSTHTSPHPIRRTPAFGTRGGASTAVDVARLERDSAQLRVPTRTVARGRPT